MRTVQLSSELAVALGRLRAARFEGVSSPNLTREPASARVRLQDIEAVERELDVVLPDPVIAYLAAGVSLWGDGPIDISAIRERTLAVRELIEEDGGEWYEAEEHDAETLRIERFAVIDDDANGNYIAVPAGLPRASDGLSFLDHETGFECEPPTMSLLAEIERVLKDSDVRGEPFSVEIYDQPDPVPEPVWVSHSKFGRGKVVAEVGDTLTVMFESVGEKRLKRSFLSFE